jgi:hypothetical protein
MHKKILIGRPEWKRARERTRRRWENNIRVDLREIGWGSVDLFRLAKDRDQWRILVNTVFELLAFIKGGECLD